LKARAFARAARDNFTSLNESEWIQSCQSVLSALENLVQGSMGGEAGQDDLPR